MKKIGYLIVILLSLFSFSFSAYAVAYCPKTDWSHSLIYLIDNFEIIANGKIKVDGWAFIDHVDNYGGVNMKSYIIAYKGDWGKDDISDNNINDCDSATSNCITFPNKVVEIAENNTGVYKSGLNMYWTRCTDVGCRENSYKKVKNELLNGARDFDNNCPYNDDVGGSHCLYENVGFSNEIDLSTIYNKLGYESDIKFRIYVQVEYGGNRNELSEACSYKFSRDLAVNEGVVKGGEVDLNFTDSEDAGIEDGKVLKFKSNFDVSNEVHYNYISVGGFSNEVLYTAVSSTPKWGSDLTSNLGCQSTPNLKYYLDTSKFIKGISNNVVSGWSKYGKSVASKVYAIKQNVKQYGFCTPGNADADTVYIPVSWAVASGAVTIKYSPPNIEKGTPVCVCLGSNCDVNGENHDSCDLETPSDNKCSGDKKETCSDVAFKETSCSKHFKDSGRRDYYYVTAEELHKKIKNTEFFRTNSNYNGWEIIEVIPYGSYRHSNDKTTYLLPVQFYTKIKYTQNNGKLSFVKSIDNTNNKIDKIFVDDRSVEVAAGRPFNFSIDYNVNVSWNSDVPNVRYINRVEVKQLIMRDLNGNEQTINLSSTDTGKKLFIYYDFTDEDDMYYLKEGKYWTKYRESGIVVSNMYKEVAKTFKNSFVNDLGLDVYFPTSNTKDGDIKTNTYGGFSCNEVSSTANSKEVSCKYALRQAYQDRDGYIVYGNSSDEDGNFNDKYTSMSNIGSLYYARSDLKSGTDLSFEIRSDNLSLIDGVNYSYNAICHVNVYNELFGDSAVVNYRPIDLSNPFPKKGANCEGIASNWKEYCEKYGDNFSRITNQLNNLNRISYQTKKIRSLPNNVDYGHYNVLSVPEFGGENDKSGISSFIRDDNVFNIVNGKHCGIGSYNPSCDSEQWNS